MRDSDIGSRTGVVAALAIVLVLPLAAQQGRLASDFEIAQMERQLERSQSFEAQLSGRLNLGDARAARNEISLARAEYGRALDIASRTRLEARRAADVTRYAIATSYAALAEAKLGRDQSAFNLLEESIRYLSDDAEIWNLYSSTARILRYPRKAVSAARNAVAIASRDTSTVKRKLDLAVYQYALANSLVESGETREAETLLAAITTTLRSPDFASLSRQVARQEAFEVYSSAHGDVAAYVSLLNRSQLRLASIYETSGRPGAAREQYLRVLEGRSDDPTALVALARLAESPRDRERRYAEAFEANPFSLPLVREYQQQLASGTVTAPSSGTSAGARMQQALGRLARGERRAATAALESLAASFPDNATIRLLMREAEPVTAARIPSPTPTADELRALLDGFEALSPEQRVTLDQMSFTSIVRFAPAAQEAAEGQTILTSGTIEGIPFTFAMPTRFTGSFGAGDPLRLTYTILGVTQTAGVATLLLEPVRVEVPR